MKDEKRSSNILKKTSSPSKTAQGKKDDENGKKIGFKSHAEVLRNALEEVKEKLNEKRDKLHDLKAELTDIQTKDKEKLWEIDQLKVEKKDLKERLDKAEKSL